MVRAKKMPETSSQGGSAGAMLMRSQSTRLHLSRSEAQVADLVLEDPRLFVSSPITDIAKAAKVTQPTVIRFCRSLGCDGLHDFKLKLSGTLNGDATISFTQVEQDDSIGSISEKVLGNTANALLSLREEISARSLEKAIALLKKARRVDVFALGSSASVADDAQYKLIRSGINASARTDAYMMSLCAERLGKDDVAMFISRSGQTPELIEAANLAKANGASILSLAPAKTPLARKSDAVIVINTDEERQTKPAMLTRILQLALIDVLSVVLSVAESNV